MAHLIARIPRGEASAEPDEFDLSCEIFQRLKGVSLTDILKSDSVEIGVGPSRHVARKRIWRSAEGAVWLVDLGAWLPLPARSGLDGRWLVQQYLEFGPDHLAQSLQGQFAILIGDQRSRSVHAITDRCGSLHLFVRQDTEATWLSTSSSALGRGKPSDLDPMALHEFVATGIVFEERTLWKGVRKVPPATVLTVSAGRTEERRYWRFSEVGSESLGVEQAAEAVLQGLTGVLDALPDSEQPLVADLTGGYDSRLLLAGLLASKRRFETTVSGMPSHPDVVVSSQIARELGFAHTVVQPPGPPSGSQFEDALRLTDGEYDAFDYARILHVHSMLSERYSISLNGSFGELARGYWWELLWPRLGKQCPIDSRHVARARFAAIPYDAGLFEGDARLSLADHMTGVVERAAQEANQLPNTSQLDAVYYSVRMQRWQGRIASSTMQIWPSISPLGFAQALSPILAARSSARFRSLLVRVLLARHAPRLAAIPLEHGYPPCPATWKNLVRFAPVIAHYGRKAALKVSRHLGFGARTSTPDTMSETTPGKLYRQLFRDRPLVDWLARPALAESGLLAPERLVAALDPEVPRRGTALEQWRRLTTVEASLQYIHQTRMKAQGSSDSASLRQ